jgi:ATP-dependent Clp protease ATP-binding subunit ClpC
MTSNLGAGQAKRSIGFTAEQAAPADDRMLAAAKSAFLPEFLNRIDEIVTFRPLEEAQIEQITAQIIGRVADRLRVERQIELEVDDALIARLAREGFDPEYGARPLQRHVRRTLEKALTRAIVAGEIADGTRVQASEGPDGIVLRTLSQPELALAA